jgi:hypothetical protein
MPLAYNVRNRTLKKENPMRYWSLLILLAVSLCAGPTLAQDDDTDDLPASPATDYTPTSHGMDGNRVVSGRGTFPQAQQFDVDAPDALNWIVGAVVADRPVWIVADEAGTLYGVYELEPGAYTLTPALSDTLPAGMPPVMVTDTVGSFLDVAYPLNLSPASHAARIQDRTVYINQEGQLVLLDGNNAPLQIIDADAQPDARPVINALGQAASYIQATNTRYVHNIMGDELEAAGLLVMDMGFGTISNTVMLPGTAVFEGLSPIWADVDADGQPDLITTVSDFDAGAQLRVYGTDGAIIAQGDPIGRGARWRHQLAWAAFGPAGENLLVEVLTPHIGGIVGWFRYDGAGGLERVARYDGFTSHVINSRNLDMAVAGDFDGDGTPEIVLPSQDRSRVAGLQLDAAYNVVEAWSFPLDGTLTTNLSAVELPDGRLALAVGVQTDDGATVRVWAPAE